MTELLISVRSAPEARIALQAGCNWLDVKEPARGSLGRADAAIWKDVARELQSHPVVQGSLALGELSEAKSLPDQRSLPSRFTWLKIGLSRMGQRSNWVDDWQTVRKRVASQTSHPINWVAVVYADWQAAQAPPPDEIIEAAIKTDCQAVLFDTYHKTGNTLWDSLYVEQLQTYRQHIQRQNKRMAIAGGITLQHLDQCIELQPDIVGVRGAVCEQGQRRAGICQKMLGELRDKLNTHATCIQPI